MSTSRGHFGSEHDPTRVVYAPCGRLELRLGCNSRHMGYDARSSTYGAASRSLVWLTNVEGLGCDQQLFELVTATSQLRGSWKSDAFRLFASIDANRFNFFQVTAQSCLKVSEGPAAALGGAL